MVDLKLNTQYFFIMIMCMIPLARKNEKCLLVGDICNYLKCFSVKILWIPLYMKGAATASSGASALFYTVLLG